MSRLLQCIDVTQTRGGALLLGVARQAKFVECKMARISVFVLLVIASAVCYQIDVERGGPSQLRPAPLGSGAPALSRPPTASVVSDARAKVGKWLRAYQGFVAGAAKVSQLISFVCGVWLLFSSPFAIVFSLMTARVPDAILCGFLGVFGVLLSLLELPIGAVQRVLQQYFFFAYTRPGRAALVVLIATIAWACAKVRPHVRLPSIMWPASGSTWSHALMPSIPGVSVAGRLHDESTHRLQCTPHLLHPELTVSPLCERRC